MKEEEQVVIENGEKMEELERILIEKYLVLLKKGDLDSCERLSKMLIDLLSAKVGLIHAYMEMGE